MDESDLLAINLHANWKEKRWFLKSFDVTKTKNKTTRWKAFHFWIFLFQILTSYLQISRRRYFVSTKEKARLIKNLDSRWERERWKKYVYLDECVRESHSRSPEPPEKKRINTSTYAVRMQVPPASLIFFSARALKNLALTIIGSLGKWPLPRTLKKPCLPTSRTAALPGVGVRWSSGRRDTSCKEGKEWQEVNGFW